MSETLSTFFTIQDIPKGKRYSAFQESMSTVYEAFDPSVRNKSLTGTVSSHFVHDALLVEVEANEQNFFRTQSKIASDSFDHYMIQTYRYGYTQRLDGTGACCGNSNNVIIYDASEAWESRTSDFSNITLIVPRNWIEEKVVHRDGHHGKLLSIDTTEGKMLQDSLFFLTQTTNNAEQSKNTLTDCLHLVATLLNSEPSDRKRVRSSHEQAYESCSRVLELKVKRFIDMHLQRNSLSVQFISEALGVSRSHLYRIFAKEHGIAHYIKERRLTVAFAQLLEGGKSVTEVSNIAGFKSVSTFRRNFKNRFGFTPQDVYQVQRSECAISAKEVNRSWMQWFSE